MTQYLLQLHSEAQSSAISLLLSGCVHLRECWEIRLEGVIHCDEGHHLQYLLSFIAVAWRGSVISTTWCLAQVKLLPFSIPDVLPAALGLSSCRWRAKATMESFRKWNPGTSFSVTVWSSRCGLQKPNKKIPHCLTTVSSCMIAVAENSTEACDYRLPVVNFIHGLGHGTYLLLSESL